MDPPLPPGSPPPPVARLFRWWRPSRYVEVVRFHLIPAWFSAALLAVAWVLPWSPLRPQPCTFKGLTGIPCAFCGSTRTFEGLMHGQWGDAIRNSPLAALLFVLCGLVLLWNGTALATGRRIARGRWLRPNRPGWRRLWIAAGCLLLANWVYRILWIE